MNAPLETASMRHSRRDFLLLLLGRRGMPWIWAAAAAMLVAGTLGVILDPRWWIIALMIPCAVIPPLFMFLYMAYALSPRCLPLVHDHRVRVDARGLTIIYNPGRETEVVVPGKDIVLVRPGIKAVLIEMTTPYGLLSIPYTALDACGGAPGLLSALSTLRKQKTAQCR